MKALLWKEFREYYLQFAILCAFAIGILVLLDYFNSFDSDIVIGAFFLVCAPLFSFFFSMNIVSNEVSGNTFPFLVSLPVSRKKLWAAKLISSTIFCLAIYATYIFLAYFSGVSTIKFPVLPPGFLLSTFDTLMKILPVFLISAGLCLTMFSAAIKFGILASIILFWYSLYLLEALPTLNYFLGIPLISMAFLFASYCTFVGGRLMNSWKETIRGLSFLFAGLAITISIWVLLDFISNRQTGFEGSEIESLTVEENNSLTFVTRSEPRWFDPIQNTEITRVFSMNPFNGKCEQVDNRGTMYKWQQGPIKAVLTRYHWPGFFSSPYVKFYRDTITLQNFFQVEKFLDFDLITSNLAIYSVERRDTFNVRFIDYKLWEIGSGSVTIHSCPAGTSCYPFLNKKADRIFFNHLNSPFLFDLSQKRSLSLALQGNHEAFYGTDSGFIARKYFPNSESPQPDEGVSEARTFFIQASGTIQPLHWMPPRIFFLAQGKNDVLPCCWAEKTDPASDESDNASRTYHFAWCDLKGQTLSSIATFTEGRISFRSICIDRPQTSILFSCQGPPYRAFLLEIPSGKIIEVQMPEKNIWAATSFGEKKFVINSGGSLWSVDFSQGTSKLLLNLNSSRSQSN